MLTDEQIEAVKNSSRRKRKPRARREHEPQPLPEGTPDDEALDSRQVAKLTESERAEFEAMKRAAREGKQHKGLRAKLVEAVNVKDIADLPRQTIGDELVYQLMKKAFKGQGDAARYVFDQVIGKPTTRVVAKTKSHRTHELIMPPESQAPMPKALADSLAINSKVKVIRRPEPSGVVDGEIVLADAFPDLDPTESPDDDGMGDEG